ncbi:MAG: hypothetical protein PSX81_01665 [bacterium]|nr:hypothetical protein [bacterium]
MKNAPTVAFNLFVTSIILLFFATLFYFLSIDGFDMLFFLGLLLLSSFSLSIIGVINGITFKANDYIEKRKNKIGITGNIFIISLFIMAIILLAIEINNHI